MKIPNLATVFTVLMLTSFAGVALEYNTPFKLWMLSSSRPYMNQKECLPGWDLNNLQKLSDRNRPMDFQKLSYANKLLADSVAARFKNENRRLDGGPGDDVLGWSGSDLLLGDFRVVNFENLISTSDKPMKIVALASGLASAENRVMTFHHGKARLEVYMDSCLKWGYPKKINLSRTIGNRKYIYTTEITGRDSKGEEVTVRISNGVKLRYLTRFAVRRWSRALINYSKE